MPLGTMIVTVPVGNRYYWFKSDGITYVLTANYTGHWPNLTTNAHVKSPADLSGSFTVSNLLVPNIVTGDLLTAAITPLSWNFTDGIDVWNNQTTTFTGHALVDANGLPLLWYFGFDCTTTSTESAGPSCPGVRSQNAFGPLASEDKTPVGDTKGLGEVGSWTITIKGGEPTPTSEPGTLPLLFGGGLFGLVLLKFKP